MSTPVDQMPWETGDCGGFYRWWHSFCRRRTFSGTRSDYHWWCQCGRAYRRSQEYRDKMSVYLAARAKRERKLNGC